MYGASPDFASIADSGDEAIIVALERYPLEASFALAELQPLTCLALLH